mmetsp:Transcript_107486/g.302506  ORF Transcript_107486/g.302506 Transcript_107486/m.302506 type:complete len:666 (-) Transcript_107486:205-2202(-)
MGNGASVETSSRKQRHQQLLAEYERLKPTLNEEQAALMENVLAYSKEVDVVVEELRRENEKLKTGGAPNPYDGVTDDAKLAEIFMETEELPHGVDFANLQEGSGCNPEEAEGLYKAALDEAGGELNGFAKRVALLEAEVERRREKGNEQPYQFNAYQSYNVQDFVSMATRQETFEFGKNKILQLERQLLDGGHKCKVAIAPTKGWERAASKVLIKYAGDASRLVDVCRCTFEAPSTADLFEMLAAAVEEWSTSAASIVQLEDRYFQRCMRGGYRDVQMLVRFGGVVWEVQFNTTPLLRVKMGAGHKAYETTRFIHERVLLFAMRSQPLKLRGLVACPGVRPIANPNAVKDKNGLLALHHAALQGSLPLLEVLLDMPNAADSLRLEKEGRLAATLAALNVQWPAVAFIIERMDAAVSRLTPEKASGPLVMALDDAADVCHSLGRHDLAARIEDLAVRARALMPAEIETLEAQDYGKIEVPKDHYVIRAYLGDGQRQWDLTAGMDVTKSFKAKLDGGGVFVGNPFSKIYADCAHGVTKKVFVMICKDPGRQAPSDIEGWDGDVPVIIQNQNAVIVPNDRKILRAFFGAGDYPWDETAGADVTEKLKKIVAGEEANCPRNEDGVILQSFLQYFGDPAPGVSKKLFVELDAKAGRKKERSDAKTNATNA